MYTEIAEIVVGTGIVDGFEDELQLLRGTEAELGEKVQVLRIKVRTGILEKLELVVGKRYILEF